MEENIHKLFESLNRISVKYLTGADRSNLKETKKEIPRIQQFVLWFLEENRFGIEPELYRDMSENLLRILEDILTSLQQEDHVLLHDAVAYGLLEYLKLFIGQEEETDDYL